MGKELSYKDCLTNELLQKRFPSQFDLVRYAIRKAENEIRTGKEHTHTTGNQNLAFSILSEIANHKNSLVQEEDESLEVEDVLAQKISQEEKKEPSRKKNRAVTALD